jgi:hypothetical protein
MADSAAAAPRLHGRDAVVGWWRQRMLTLPSGAAGSVLLWCDDDFSGWPLDEPESLQALAQWLRPAGRQLTMLARDYGGMSRQHPRFCRWRRDWVHRVATLQPEEAAVALGPTAWLDSQAAMLWLHRTQWVAQAVHGGPGLAQVRGETDALLQRCVPAWPVNTAGL